MRVVSRVIGLTLLVPAAAFAQPVAGPPPPPEPPPAAAPAPAPAPITITITNTSTSTGNTSTNTTTSSGNTSTNTDTNTNTNENENTSTATASAAPPPAVPPPPPAIVEAPPEVGCGHWHSGPAERWLSIGALHGHHEHGGGARIAVDMLGRGHWTLGVAGNVLGHRGNDGFDTDSGEASWRLRASGVVYAAWSRSFGHWSLRAQLGFGGGVVDVPSPTVARSTQPGGTSSSDTDHKWVKVGEASLMLGRSFGDHWGIGIGPVVTAMASRDHDDHQHAHEAMLFVALRRKL